MTGQAMPRSWLAGLIGHGVGPSLTPELHEREAQRQGLRYVYKVVEQPAGPLDTRRLERLLAGAIELGFDGLNVTHPAKQAMVPLVDERDSAVESIGALNTVLIRGGRTTGHNTDVTGFLQAFELGLPDVDRDRVVLIGAGGAGTAVAHALVQLGVKQLLVVDPDQHRAEVAPAFPRRAPDRRRARAGLPVRTRRMRWRRARESSTRARWGWRPTRARRSRTDCSDRTCGWPTSSTARSTPRC